MDFPEVLSDFFHRHMPSTVIACRDIREAFFAIKWATVQELLQAGLIRGTDIVHGQRNLDRRLAFFTRAAVVLINDGFVMLVDSTWHDSSSRA
jgi:hypothetical protein